MPFPKPVKDVPRDRVHAVVKTMLQNPAVGTVSCLERKSGKYTILPRKHINS